MARGEPAPRGERGPGLAIWASFAVVCLGALFFTLWSMRACETGLVPPVTASPQPFPGAEAALVPLGTRGCLDRGGPAIPGGPGPTTAAHVTQWFRDHGYDAPTEAWEGHTLPLTTTVEELAGGCGVVAFVTSDYIAGVIGPDGSTVGACDPTAVVVPMCGDGVVRVDGSGTVQERVFVMPGLTAAGVEQIGMPLGAVLGHAEAEAHLRAMGWQPADEVVRVRVPTAGIMGLVPPADPTSGCIGWVATSVDLGRANTQWLGRPVDYDGSAREITVGMLSCRSDPSAAPTGTTLNVYDEDTRGGELFFRPYAPAAGPVVGGAGSSRRAIGLGSMRVVEAAPSALPRSVEMTAPDE